MLGLEFYGLLDRMEDIANEMNHIFFLASAGADD